MTRRTRVALAAAGLVAATLATYAPVRTHGFLNYDDPAYVTANPHVRAGLSVAGVAWALVTTQPHNWHPVTWMSHMLDVTLFGVEAPPMLLVNVALHALSTGLLFLALHQSTKAPGRSVVVAALFALHPLHVESVAWVAERKDVLSTVFALATMLAYLAWVPERRPARYAAMLGLYACAAMSKPMVVTLPVLLLLLDQWPLGRAAGRGLRAWRPLLVEKLPLFAVAAVGAGMTIVAQRASAIADVTTLSVSARAANAAVAAVSYVQKTLWPADLAVFYPYPTTLAASRVLVAATALAGFSYAAIRLRRSHPYVLVSWLWFLVGIAPVSGFLQAGVQAMADRFTYLPGVGLFVIVAWGVPDLLATLPQRRRVLAAGAAGILVVCAALTHRQLDHWRDSEALFRHALAVTTDNYLAHNNLGEALLARGATEEARDHFAASIRIEPRFPHAHNNLASLLLADGRLDDAIAEYTAAVRLDPRDPETQGNLGLAYYRRGDLDAAIAHYTVAAALDPDDARLHNNVAAAFQKRGDVAAAIAHYRRAVELDPTYERAAANLAALERRAADGGGK